jgi:hypothetical protein
MNNDEYEHIQSRKESIRKSKNHTLDTIEHLEKAKQRINHLSLPENIKHLALAGIDEIERDCKIFVRKCNLLLGKKLVSLSEMIELIAQSKLLLDKMSTKMGNIK